MFEPYKFSAGIKDYAFYVSQSKASEKITSFGAYDTYSKEIYYQEAAKNKTTNVTDPYLYEGMTVVSVSSPILSQNELQGVIIADINIDNFGKIDANSDRYTSMFATIVDGAGQIIYGSESAENSGESLNAFFANPDEYSRVLASFGQGAAFRDDIVRSDTGNKITMFFNPVVAGSETWWSLTAVDTADVNEAVVQTTIWLLILAATALIVIILTTLIVLREMLRPLQDVVTAAEAIANGHLDVAITVHSGDEIGGCRSPSCKWRVVCGKLYPIQAICSMK